MPAPDVSACWSAALDGRRDDLANSGFGRSQFLAQTKREVKKTRVDAAKFNGHEAERGLALRGRKAGHGTNAGHNKRDDKDGCKKVSRRIGLAEA